MNDAPVHTVPAPQSTNEDTALVFSSGNGNAITIGDVDAGANPVEVTLTATNGAITLSQTTGLSFTAGDGTSDAVMTFTGTVANINAALNGLVFAPTANYNGAASLQIVTNDQGNTGSGGALSDTDTVNITVNAVNDAPVHTVPAPQSTNEDTALVFSSGNGNAITIGDVDAGGSPVEVTLTASNGAITLSQTTGLSFTAGDGTSDAVMTFTGTVANINAALNGLSFAPTANYNGASSLQIVTNDQGNSGSGGALSDSDTVNITVNAVNDAPLNAVPGPQSTNEDTSLVFSRAGGNAITIGDLDAGGWFCSGDADCDQWRDYAQSDHGSLVHGRRWYERRGDDLYGQRGQYQRRFERPGVCACRQLQRRGQSPDPHQRSGQQRQRRSAL